MVARLFNMLKPQRGDEVAAHQDWLLPFVELFTIICFLINFLSALVPTPLYNNGVLFAASAAFFIIWLGFRRGLPASWTVHSTTLIGSVVCIYIISQTGATVSVAMVIYVGLAWMPFLLLNLKSAVAWLMAQANALLLLFLASQMGWITPPTVMSPDLAYWNLFVKIQAAVGLMMVLDFLARARRQQISALQQRGHELQALHTELIRAQSHKDEFIASVGHELRTPMNAILGLNGLLKDQIKDDAVDLRRVNLIRQSTQHLLTVVNDILDFSQLQADRMVLSPQIMALKQHGLAQFERLQHRASLKKIDSHMVFDDTLPTWVSLDPKRFTQTIDNLLENALKFTHEGSIYLRFLHIPSGLRVEVQDTGIGMTDEQMGQAFGRFEKTSSPAIKIYGGTGLGLSICEKLVRLQGGRIGVQSQYNQGSLFWVEIPLTQVPEPQTPMSATHVDLPTRSPTHFLIVDDHPVNLMVAQQMVEKNWPQAKISTCSSGRLALQFIQEHDDVDMILLDMFMPDMDGLAVAKAIRQRPAPGNKVAILGVTASSNANDHVLCTEAGMDGLVLKPLERDDLALGVERALQSSGQTP
jgi:signal transduction histidine kinase/ActR/RegA family two-component response regulator